MTMKLPFRGQFLFLDNKLTKRINLIRIIRNDIF